MTSFWAQMCKTGYHSTAWSMTNAVLLGANWLLIAQLQLARWAKNHLITKKRKLKIVRKLEEQRMAYSDSAAQIDYKSAETFQTIFKKYDFVTQCYHWNGICPVGWSGLYNFFENARSHPLYDAFLGADHDELIKICISSTFLGPLLEMSSSSPQARRRAQNRARQGFCGAWERCCRAHAGLMLGSEWTA